MKSQDSARRLVVWAAAWSLVLLVLAWLLPVVTVTTDRAGEQPMVSLTTFDGPIVLLIVAVPLAVSMLVGVALRRIPLIAWMLSILLVVAALVGTVTILIGAFVLPSGVLLVAACGESRSDPRKMAIHHRHSFEPPDEARE